MGPENPNLHQCREECRIDALCHLLQDHRLFDAEMLELLS